MPLPQGPNWKSNFNTIGTYRYSIIKGALNPNFFNLIINRKNFSLYKRFGPIFELVFVKKYARMLSPLRSIKFYSWISDKIRS